MIEAIFERIQHVEQVTRRAGFVKINFISDLVPTVKCHQHNQLESVKSERNSSFTLGTAQGLNILALPFKPA